jgi:serine phosphatase RsbU (regulator of sigma subunit)
MPTLDQLYDVLTAPPREHLLQAGQPERRLAAHAGAIGRDLPAVEVSRSNDEVMAHFNARPDLEALAVIEDERPVGLINRSAFLEAYVRPFAREIYGRKSCAAWMDRAPLVVEVDTPVELLVHRAVAWGAKVLKDGFITVRAGRYAGIGTGFALLEAMSAIEAEKTRQLLASIEYASMIQRSHLGPSDEALARAVPDHAVAWLPRDVVGGDCYFFRETRRGLFGAVLDCTGHGVPGAFMTLIALSFLDQHVGDERCEPGEVLAALDAQIKRVLGQDGGADETGRIDHSDDGLDGACLLLQSGGEELLFAGARLPLFLARQDGQPATVIDGERMSVGYQDTPAGHAWTTQRIALRPGDLVTIATDGVFDQVGGPKRIGFGRRRLAQLVGDHRGHPAAALPGAFRQAFDAWQGNQARRDDVTLVALAIAGRA